MDQIFDLPVIYKGEEITFKTTFIQSGYTYKFLVDIDGIEMTFEKDDEQNFRVLVYPENSELLGKLDNELFTNIAESLENILK